ncbi:hypothetical protein [Bacillus cereus]|uniref:Uncharacterized protein n=1 Tax=Bacillus cereus MC67 TaxID=1053219 RepID=J8FI85_BACCE|nr:hypothetical protein [Bacillus cereus]EJR03178.1 hypothetical protein II3_01095 [Bacillus cereus MC67]EOP13852.1 hypothetical protein II1_03056 [Bacillus cereus MC118]
MARPHNPTGGPSTPEGKAKALKNLTPGNYIHGLYLKDFKADLTEEEKAWYKEMFEHYQEKYELDKLDLETLDLALINLIKARRKNVNMEYAVNEKVSMADFESRYIRLIDELGLSRKYRLSKGNIENPNTFDPSMLFDN